MGSSSGLAKKVCGAMWGVELTVMAAMIAFNSVFAAYEIALASVSRVRLDVLLTERRKGAAAATYMKDNIEGSLAGIQLGITLVGAIAAATGGAGAGELLAPTIEQWLGGSRALAQFLAITAVVVPLTLVTIIFGELIPKVFALRNTEWVCLHMSPPMKWFVSAVWPIVWMLETVITGAIDWFEHLLEGRMKSFRRQEGTELQELRASAALARTSRLIGARQERIIMGAASLSTRPVREIMLPAEDMTMINVNGSIHDALVAAHLDMHTRFPLTEQEGDPQAVIGYVNFKDIVAAMRLAPQATSLRAILRAIPSLSDETPVSACLERLIRGHVHISLVRDQDNRVVGMVTLEDLLEEMVGDIEDEFDHLPAHVAASGRGWVVGGGTNPDKLLNIAGIALPPLDGANASLPVRHVSDWVCHQLDEPLRGGEIIERGPIRLVVRKIRRQKVLEAQIENRLSTTETNGSAYESSTTESSAT